MNLREAAKMALDALQYPLETSSQSFDADKAELLSHRAIDALRTALAESERKPTHIPESWATHGGLWIEALYRNKDNT